MSVEKRKFTRIHYQVPLLYEDQDEVYIGKINNISLHGIELREFPHFPQDRIFRISFPLAILTNLSEFDIKNLRKFVVEEANGPQKVSVHLELMRKQWDSSQNQSKGSVIGGQFYNESREFSSAIESFFDNYEANIRFIQRCLKESPECIQFKWFEKLTFWLGLPSFGQSSESCFLMQDFIDSNYLNTH